MGKKALGNAHGLLAGHRVSHEQDFVWADFRLYRLQLAHELFVDLQPSRRVDDNEAQSILLGVLDGRLSQLRRLLVCVVEHGHVDLLAERLQLSNCRGTIRIGGHEERLVAHLADLHRQLAGGRRLAGALQANQHHDSRRFGGHRQPRRRGAQQLDQLVVDDLDDCLCRRKTVHDVLADRFFLDRVDELAYDFERNVGFEKRYPHFA